MGTRFLPASKAIPKEMLTVVDKPLIQYAVEEAQAAGIEQFIFVTSRGKAAIEDHFDHNEEMHALLTARGKAAELAILESVRLAPGAASFTRQQEPLGLGHAVLCARDLVGDEPFAVLLPDELLLSDPPCLAELAALYEQTGGCVIGLAEVPPAETNRYGIVGVSAEQGRSVTVSAMIEKPEPAEAPSSLAIIGRYIFQPEVFGLLERQPPGVGGEIQLTDSMAAMVGQGPFHGLRYAGRRFDCGSKVGFLQANIAYALERPELRKDLLTFLQKNMPSTE
jgi:UTP--glucose-1-phosphate uridylyltransferase